MQRRQLLESLVATLAVGGCLGRNNSTATPIDTPTSSPTSTPTQTPTSTPVKQNNEPTVRPTTESPSDIEYFSFEKWFSTGNWAFKITDLEKRTKFYDVFEKQKEMEMPDGKQLLVAYLEMKNISPEKQYNPFWATFGIVTDESSYEAVGGFEHPAYDSKVDLDWIQLAKNIPRLQQVLIHDSEIPSGSVVPRWFGVVLPRSVETDDVEIGYADDKKFDVRWFPPA